MIITQSQYDEAIDRIREINRDLFREVLPDALVIGALFLVLVLALVLKGAN